MSKPTVRGEENNNMTIAPSEEPTARDEARQYILDGIDAELSPFNILDGLSSFYDGDPFELF